MQNSTNMATKKRTNHKFKPEEDLQLRKLVKQYGVLSWEEIATLMEGRNARQCRDRWYYYLSPKINNEPWSAEEDRRLIQICYELNGKWTKIAKRFKGRTDTQIKNRWNTLKKTLNLPNIKQQTKPSLINKTEASSSQEFSDAASPAAPQTEQQGTSLLFDKFLSLFNEQDNFGSDNIFDFFA